MDDKLALAAIVGLEDRFGPNAAERAKMGLTLLIEEPDLPPEVFRRIAAFAANPVADELRMLRCSILTLSPSELPEGLRVALALQLAQDGSFGGAALAKLLAGVPYSRRVLFRRDVQDLMYMADLNLMDAEEGLAVFDGDGSFSTELHKVLANPASPTISP